MCEDLKRQLKAANERLLAIERQRERMQTYIATLTDQLKRAEDRSKDRRTTMGKRHKPEEIIAKLRQVEVMIGQDTSMADAKVERLFDGARASWRSQRCPSTVKERL